MFGVIPLLAVAFIVLKILGLITWSWMWVLSPLWIPAVVGLLMLVGCALIILGGAVIAVLLD